MKNLLKRIEAIRLTRLFPLVERYYLVRDSDGDIWLFREYLHNGTYPKYTLTGKNHKGQGYIGAHLYAKFLCICEADPVVNVFIEDIVTAKRRASIGSWMMNTMIAFLRTADSFTPIGRIYGDIVRDSPDEPGARIRFFQRFGFSLEQTPQGRHNISAHLSELHQVGLSEIEEINIEYALMDWSKKISPNNKTKATRQKPSGSQDTTPRGQGGPGTS